MIYLLRETGVKRLHALIILSVVTMTKAREHNYFMNYGRDGKAEVKKRADYHVGTY